ncbi:MAG: sulfatase/phosphatase domain-containing protein [Bacteroidota bacterium]
MSDNTPLRGGKSQPYERVLRIPFFCVWPNHIPENGNYKKQVISLDIAATAIKAAGGELPKEKKLDGLDLMPVIANHEESAHKYEIADNDTTYYVLNKNGSGKFER